MRAEDCVDAALARLDDGEALTSPSVEDVGAWAAHDEAHQALLGASQSSRPASRYRLT